MLIVDNALQIHKWDAQAMEEFQCTSIQLMERAAHAFVDYFKSTYPLASTATIDVMCGPGNNGGDGAAIARLLEAEGYNCSVYGFCDALEKRSPDLIENWNRLTQLDTHRLHLNEEYAPTAQVDVVIDALFGVSIDRPLGAAFAKTVKTINTSDHICQVISVDVPSGQRIDGTHPDWLSILADETVTFAALKLSSILQETAGAWGRIHLDDLMFPLPEWYIASTPKILLAADYLETLILQPRSQFTHKGSFGHVLVMAGSRGHAGAAVLSGRAAYRAGCGLVSFYVPSGLEQIMQIGLPEAMCLRDPDPDFLSNVPNLDPYDAIVIGPGIGKLPQVETMLLALFKQVGQTPIVIDADALNLIAQNEVLFDALPSHSIFTPHPKEFARLTSKASSDLDRFEKLKAFAKTLPGADAVVVLKDQYTVIVNQQEEVRINFFAGNPGMATGGMGDALTGVIASLAAQGLSTFDAASLGVLLHAKAGDLAAKDLGEAGVLAGDVAHRIGMAIQQIQSETDKVSR